MSKENDFIVEQFIQSVQTTSQLIQRLSEQIKDNDISLESLRGELSSIKENLEAISGIVRDGNGDKPLTSRLDLLEQELTHVQHSIESHITDCKKTKEDEQQTSDTEKKLVKEKKWNMTILVISSLLGFISSMIVVLVRIKAGQ